MRSIDIRSLRLLENNHIKMIPVHFATIKILEK